MSGQIYTIAELIEIIRTSNNPEIRVMAAEMLVVTALKDQLEADIKKSVAA